MCPRDVRKSLAYEFSVLALGPEGQPGKRA